MGREEILILVILVTYNFNNFSYLITLDTSFVSNNLQLTNFNIYLYLFR